MEGANVACRFVAAGPWFTIAWRRAGSRVFHHDFIEWSFQSDHLGVESAAKLGQSANQSLRFQSRIEWKAHERAVQSSSRVMRSEERRFKPGAGGGGWHGIRGQLPATPNIWSHRQEAEAVSNESFMDISREESRPSKSPPDTLHCAHNKSLRRIAERRGLAAIALQPPAPLPAGSACR